MYVCTDDLCTDDLQNTRLLQLYINLTDIPISGNRPGTNFPENCSATISGSIRTFLPLHRSF